MSLRGVSIMSTSCPRECKPFSHLREWEAIPPISTKVAEPSPTSVEEGWSSDDESLTALSEGGLALSGARTVSLKAVAGLLLLAAVTAALVARVACSSWHSNAHSDRSRGNVAIAGVSLQPGSQALPALPAASVAAPALPAGDLPHQSEGEAVAILAAAAASAQNSTLPELRKYDQPVVVFGMLIKNLDYARLLAAPNFFETFNATVKQAVATEAGIGVEPEDVKLVVSPGDEEEVVIECTILVGDTEVASDVQLAVGASSKLRGELGLNLRTIISMDIFADVAVGRVEVASVSDPVVYGTQPPTTTSSGPSTTTRLTLPMTTTPQACKATGIMCFMHAECCSGRCTSGHKCGASMAEYTLSD